MTKEEYNSNGDAETLTKIHAYNGIRSFLSPETNKKLINELRIQNGIERRISGLNCEYEFALIAYFSEKFEYILGFDEFFSKLMNVKTPDFLLKSKNGKKYIIEVKSSSKTNKFSDITESSLKKRLHIAKDLNAEWLLALKMEDRWGFFDYKFFKARNRKIIYPFDLNNSIFNVFFGFDYYAITNQITAESIYSNKSDNVNRYIMHEEYGFLTQYTLKTQTTCLIDSSSKNESVFAEVLHDLFTNKKIKKLNENETRLTETLDESILISTDQCMIATILHIINAFGNLSDPKTFFDDFINHKHEESQINAYRHFWSKIIQKCTNYEIFIPSKVIFKKDGSFVAELK